MLKTDSLKQKLNLAFLLQGSLIAVAAILSVFFATVVIDEILIKEAIKQEADYFWEKHQSDTGFPLPDTSNLTGYFDRRDLPEYIDPESPMEGGFHQFTGPQGKYVLFVSQKDTRTLYLVYSRGDVDYLATYYGLVPLSLVLIALYISLWLAYRFSHRAISPITWLASQVNRLDLDASDFSPLVKHNLPYSVDEDIQVLSDAMVNLGKRLEAFIMRERNFTRDASHELRSPLTVINIAADLLLSEQELPPPAKASVLRIKRAIGDMEELIDAFLLLARESDRALPTDIVCINDVLEAETERAHMLVGNKPIKIHYDSAAKLCLRTSDKVLAILFGNIIRNAILYTDEGCVNIYVNHKSVVIQDSGKGIPEQNVKEVFKPYYRGSTDHSGYGIGLTIVKRLTDRFNWPIDIESRPGSGTKIRIQFPQAESI